MYFSENQLNLCDNSFKNELTSLHYFSTMFLFTRLSVMWYMNGVIPSINALAAMFSFMSSSMFTMFAMWFDMEENKSLR